MTGSKWIKNLSLKAETLKLLEKNIGSTLQDLRMGKFSLNMTPFAKPSVDNCDLIKLKRFCTAKETIR